MLVNSFDKLKSLGSSEETEDVKRDGLGGLGCSLCFLISQRGSSRRGAAPESLPNRGSNRSLAVIHFTQISRVKPLTKSLLKSGTRQDVKIIRRRYKI